MAGTFLPGRTETRTPMNVFVELYSLDNATYEITTTIDVSHHGARVLTNVPWASDQRVAVRMVRGNVNSQARIVHCQARAGQKFEVGLRFDEPTQPWPMAAGACAR